MENVHIHLLVHRTRSRCGFAVPAQCDHAAFKGRVWDCLKTREGALRNPFAVVAEILSEELHYGELSVECETASA